MKHDYRFRSNYNNRRSEKVLDRGMSGLSYHYFVEHREEIEARRSLEREADNLLGDYKYGWFPKKKNRRVRKSRDI